ncbi:uncharacterized protein L3040_001490 [Drepanopeziza brunnea f. sp. 'multigermtubi']|uniref:Uncharacterized protein n=1 Tax=Marssonina brunnea f. sp. multigermtubi (strain MB_m1) TaxID=1072389 RepID=K1WUP0_MARBU|nr:uncharacterized protein MBM_05220 [Drepanopeziza brunnea f. sp. 'multigermtubi' MB_m1]EKD16751.1 hypothetical protein MBM_05220 [Drepanopeziza brunnea f. sp. 'multigermtubi' MB_m1]KAJ5051717.1 hypothetical protein L3040_001490 [Drepanopeziza brunnea f. sp. 'multigermtubi']
MASTTPTPSIPTIPPKTRPRRESRFTEGSALTGSEVHLQSSHDNSFLLAVLQQEDELQERKRKARSDSSASNASTDSFSFSAARRRYTTPAWPSNGGQSPVQPDFAVPDSLKHFGQRTIAFGVRSEDALRRSLEERPREIAESVEGIATRFKGRLRALTAGGRDRHIKPYPGT